MDKISVIIPCYNVEDKIDRCVKSLVGQTIGIENLELIFVDDASTDNTLDKLYEWEEKYPDSIMVIQCAENGKQGTARNIGMSYATGEYIGFVDSDDWADDDMYEVLYNAIVEYDCELASIRFQREDEDGVIYDIESDDFEYNKRIEINTVEDRKHFISSDRLPGGVYTKLYRKELLVNNHIVFPENLIFEDNFFGGVLSFCVKSYVILNEKKYHYIVSENSTIVVMGERNLDRLTIELLKIQEYKNRGLLSDYHDEIERDFIRNYWCGNLQRLFIHFEEIPYHIINEMKKNVLELFPGYKENDYLRNANELQKTFIKMLEVELSKDDIDFIAENFRIIWNDMINQMLHDEQQRAT